LTPGALKRIEAGDADLKAIAAGEVVVEPPA
jgi:hypothetical protein